MEGKNNPAKISNKKMPNAKRECFPGAIPSKAVKKLMKEEEKKRQEAMRIDRPIVPKLVSPQEEKDSRPKKSTQQAVGPVVTITPVPASWSTPASASVPMTATPTTKPVATPGMVTVTVSGTTH